MLNYKKPQGYNNKCNILTRLYPGLKNDLKAWGQLKKFKYKILDSITELLFFSYVNGIWLY